ncbi:MAG: hypothetical protein HYZ16_02585 [Bacteroidetes bacterium]|nr:hypothetical protein [Bacteroidota bacterium]
MLSAQDLPLDRRICPQPAYPLGGWQYIGHLADTTDHGIQGRTSCIYVDHVHDTSLNTVYVGTENSGLWRTRNFKSPMPDWHCLTEGMLWPGIGIADIAVDPKNADNIFIATALGLPFEWKYGLGALRSVNGGLTWHESNLTLGKANLGGLFAQRVLIAKPKRSGKQHLVLLADKTAYLSKDGGQTCVPVYTLPNVEGGSSKYYFNDLVQLAHSPGTMWASSVDQYLANGGARLLGASHGGRQWADYSHLLSHNYDSATGATDFIRLELAPDPHRPEVLYAFGIGEGSKRVVYRIVGGRSARPQVEIYTNHQAVGSWWMCDIVASTLHPNRLYLGRIRAHYLQLDNPGQPVVAPTLYGGQPVHVDIRDWFLVGKGQEEYLYAANDGGVAVFGPLANGQHGWQNKTGRGLAIGQFYGVGASTAHGLVVGGAQDLGGFVFGPQGRHHYCGDGYQAEVDPTTGQYFLAFNDKVAAYPHATECGRTALPIGREHVSFKIDHTGKLIGAGFATGSRGDQQLANGTRGNFVFIYDTLSQKYTEISGYPYSGAHAPIDPAGFNAGLDRVGTLALAHGHSIAYMAGIRPESNKYRLWRLDYSREDSVQWRNLTLHLTKAQGFAPWQVWQEISSVAVDPTDPNAIWVGYGGGTGGASRQVAYHPNTLDSLQTEAWQPLDAGLPQFGVHHLAMDPHTGYLYAATDVGVFVHRAPRTGAGAWECFTLGLPVVRVTDLCIDRGWVYASTYGRGLWKAPTLVPQH